MAKSSTTMATGIRASRSQRHETYCVTTPPRTRRGGAAAGERAVHTEGPPLISRFGVGDGHQRQCGRPHQGRAHAQEGLGDEQHRLVDRQPAQRRR